MKKKILSLIAVSAALAIAGSALIACGSNDGNNSVKTEVTKEQWTAAFNVENFTSNFKVVVRGTRTYGDDEKYDRQTTFAVGPQKFGNYSVSMLKYDDEGNKEEEQEIIAIIGTEFDVGYSRKNKPDASGKWTEGEWLVDKDSHRDMDINSWTRMLENVEFDTYVFAFADKYDSFKYESGKYVMEGSDIVLYEKSDETFTNKVTASTATITFANGKVASIEVKAKDEDTYTWDGETETNTNNEDYSFKFTYGVQNIVAPKVEAK